MSIKVFLADDHTVVREGLKLILESQDDISIVGDANNGRDAVKMIIKSRPDVVVMDISMPELNGIDASFQILEQIPATRIIMLSMHSSTEHIFRALRAGVRGYIIKESAGTEVIDAVRAVMKGSRYLSQKIADTVIDRYISKHTDDTMDNILHSLSSREIEILQLVAEGKSSAEIARILFLSQKTVETYRSRLMQKLNLNNIPELVKLAIKHGLVTLD